MHINNDDTYKANKDELKKKRAILKQEIESYEKNKDMWIRKAEGIFNYAKNAPKTFAKASREKKREMFVGLGSNFLLKDKKLLLDLKKPFVPIIEGMEKTRTVFPRFELLNNRLDTLKKPVIDKLSPIWSG